MEAITKYLCTFVKNSTHQNERTARNTARYQRILEFLEPAKNSIMYTNICWAIRIAKKTKSYLMMFQKEGTMVHKLWSQSCFLIKEIMEMFHKKPPDTDKELEQVDLSLRTNWKSLGQLDIGDNVRSALSKVNNDLKDDFLRTFR